MEKFGIKICVPMGFTEDDALYVLHKVFHRLENGNFIASHTIVVSPVGIDGHRFDVNFETFVKYRRIRMYGTINFVNIESLHYYRGSITNEVSEELYHSLRDHIKMQQDSLKIAENSTFGLSADAYRYWRTDAEVVKQALNDQFRGIRVTPRKVIFNNPATIVLWSDGTKTVVKRQKGDRYNKEAGLAMCYVKKFCGDNTSRGLNDILKLANNKEEK